MKKLAGSLLLIAGSLLFCFTASDNIVAGFMAGLLFGAGIFLVAFKE